MTITERAALEGLQSRCVQQLRNGNFRLATEEEQETIKQRLAEANDTWAIPGARIDYLLDRYPLFWNLANWLDDRLSIASKFPDLIAGIAIDILNKEGESGRATV